MNKLSALVVLGVFVSLAACAAPTEETDGSEGGAALSAATCAPRADAAQKKSVEACKAEGDQFDWAACMRPYDDAISAAQAAVAVQYAKIKSTVEAVSASCKAEVAAMSADEVVTAAMPTASAYAHAQTVASAQEVTYLRNNRASTCDGDAQAQLEAQLNSDALVRGNYIDYVAAVRGEKAMYAVGYAKCSVLGAVASLASASCTGLVAYQQTFAACRQECATPPTAACTPSDYGTANVPCGKLVNKKGISLLAASTTCEDVNECERTTTCDAYDQLVANGQGDTCSIDGKNGTMIATVNLDAKSGAALSAKLACH